jgi:hypothetical protein
MGNLEAEGFESGVGKTAVVALVRAEMQKPAAHGCGRVLGGRTDYDENTLSERTSQSKAEVFIHRAEPFL